MTTTRRPPRTRAFIAFGLAGLLTILDLGAVAVLRHRHRESVCLYDQQQDGRVNATPKTVDDDGRTRVQVRGDRSCVLGRRGLVRRELDGSTIDPPLPAAPPLAPPTTKGTTTSSTSTTTSTTTSTSTTVPAGTGQ